MKKIVIACTIIVVPIIIISQLVKFDITFMQPGFEDPSKATPINDSYLETLRYHIDTPAQQLLTGKVVCLNSWATWCPHCKKEIPYLRTIQQQFEQDTNIVFFSNCSDADTDSVKRFLEQQKLDFRYRLISAKPGLRSSIKKIVARKEPQYTCDTLHDAVPVTFIFDKDGGLKWYREGGIDREDVEEILSVLEQIR